MENLIDTKELILRLKQVYKDRELSLDKAHDLVKKKYGVDAISRSTVQRIFAPNSENDTFSYEPTLKQVCNSLLEVDEIESSDTPEALAMKSLLKVKKEIIQELEKITEQTKIDYAEKMQSETENFQRSIEFAKHQIELKDERIDALLAMNAELMQTNNSLIKQLMNCPLRNTEECE